MDGRRGRRTHEAVALVALTLIALTLVAGGACGAPPESPPPLDGPVADHHVHVLGPGLVADWKSLGVPFSKPDSLYTSPASLLERPDAPVSWAVLVPMAHLYGNAEFRGALRLSLDAERAAVRRENDHVAAEAARFPGRAVALCGVDLLRPYAWEEIGRCRHELASPGIKVHLASAGVNLRAEAHLAALERLAAWADSSGVALWIHFDPQRRGLEVADVARFIARVLAPRPALRAVIAHLGGSGGYGAWTRSVHRAFAGWLAAERAADRARDGIRLDLSAVWLERESEGVPASTPADGAALRADLEEFGVAHLVLGSDWPVFAPAASAAALRVGAAIPDSLWARIVGQRFPFPAPPSS